MSLTSGRGLASLNQTILGRGNPFFVSQVPTWKNDNGKAIREYFWSESINVQTTHTDLWARRNSCSDGLRCCQFWVFGRSWDRKKDNTSYNYNTMIPLMKTILQTVCAHKRSTSIFVIHLSWLSVIKLHSKQPSSHDFILAFFVLVEAGSNHT